MNLRISLSALTVLCAANAWATVSTIDGSWANQKGAPLWVIGKTSTAEDLLAGLALLNASDRPILRAQLGWLLSDKDNPAHVLALTGMPFDLNLGPSQIAEVGRQGAAPSLEIETLEGMGATHGKLVFGVVYVRFVDGTEWSHPLSRRLAFDPIPDSEITEQHGPEIRKFLEKKQEGRKQAGQSSLSEEAATAKIKEISTARPPFACPPLFVCNPANGCADFQCP